MPKIIKFHIGTVDTHWNTQIKHYLLFPNFVLGLSPKEPGTKLAKEANAITKQKSGKTEWYVEIELAEALL